MSLATDVQKTANYYFGEKVVMVRKGGKAPIGVTRNELGIVLGYGNLCCGSFLVHRCGKNFSIPVERERARVSQERERARAEADQERERERAEQARKRAISRYMYIDVFLFGERVLDRYSNTCKCVCVCVCIMLAPFS